MPLPGRSPLAMYLGDGVYVDIDDHASVVLTTEDGIVVVNRIYLEPAVLEAFLKWILRLQEPAGADKGDHLVAQCEACTWSVREAITPETTVAERVQVHQRLRRALLLHHEEAHP